MISGKQSGGLVAIAWRDGGAMALALAAAAGGRPGVRFAVELPCTRDNPEALRKAARARGLGGARFALLLGGADYQLLQAEAPAVAEGELREALRWQVKDAVNFPVDQATLDCVDIPARALAAGRPRQVLVAIASHAALRPWVQLFQDARLDLAAIDVPELAQRNLAARFETGKRGFVFLNFDEGGGLITFVYDGELLAWRRLDATLAQIAGVTPDRQEAVFDRIALELQRSVDNFERQFGGINIGRLGVLDAGGLSPLLAHLQANMSLPVELVDIATAIDFAPAGALPAGVRPATLASLCGLALRAAG